MTGLLQWRGNGIRNGDSQVAPVSQMRTNWDRLFDRFLDDVWGPASGLSGAASPGILLDVRETDEHIVVQAEVPGVEPDSLDISLVGEVLTLSGEKLFVDDGQGGRVAYSERRYGAFRRVLHLPCPVEGDDVVAEHANGVLTITLRKSAAVRPKRIQVRTA